MGIFLRLHHKKDEEATGRHESKPDRAKAAAPAPSSSSSGEKIDERSVRTQIVHLQAQERACFVSLKVRWYDQHPDTPLSDETILRFARCAPAGPFDEASAWQAMGKFDRRYLGLSAQGLRKQLRARVRDIGVSVHSTADGFLCHSLGSLTESPPTRPKLTDGVSGAGT